MHEPVTVGELLINGDTWNSYDPNLQEIVKRGDRDLHSLVGKVAKAERRCAQKLKRKHGVQVLHTPDEILIAFLKTWDEIAAEQAAQDPFFQKVLGSKREYASVVVPAKRVLFPAAYSFAADYYWGKTN